MIRLKLLLQSLLLSLGVGLVSFLAAGGSGNVRSFYQLLPKPEFALPGWAFSWVWTVLYLLMGWSDYLARTSVSADGSARKVYLFQLLLNGLWMPVFFRACWFGWALVLIGMIVVSVVILILMLRRSAPLAGWLLVPYLVFMLYAGYLNYAIILLT